MDSQKIKIGRIILIAAVGLFFIAAFCLMRKTGVSCRQPGLTALWGSR